MAAQNRLPDDPSVQLGWELDATDEDWSFAPTYYPDRFTQTKGRELERSARQCEGENVSIKKIKNREFHAKGVILASSIPDLQKVLDYENTVDLISPLTPTGGMECEIKNAELGEMAGYDPIRKEWQFKYMLDLVSTGYDEYGTQINAIVSAIGGAPGP